MPTRVESSSRVVRAALLTATGLLVGLAAGYFLFRSSFWGKAANRCSTRRAGPSGPVSGAGSSADDPAQERPGSSKDRAGPAGAGRGPLEALLRDAQARSDYLAEENERLKKLLHYYREDQKMSQGEPVGWPNSIDPRFRKAELLKAISEALREAGVKGSVTDVDCREFPCVVAGEMEGDAGPEVFKKLRDTKALAGYRKDSAMSTMSRSRSTGPDGSKKTVNHFGVAVMPRSPDSSGPDVRKRTSFRLGQLMEALSGR